MRSRKSFKNLLNGIKLAPGWLEAGKITGLSVLLAVAWFLFLYGRFPLYFSHVNWIYAAGEDMLQHQVGWEWFRLEPWHFPLGWITSFGYPFGTSITFLDSIPLLAIPFKLFSPWLGPNFQYFGLWELLSLVGQIGLGMLILREFSASRWVGALSASLLVLAPPMLWRAFVHPSLAAHWVILAGIWFTLLGYRQKLWRGAWPVLFALAFLVHAYYIPMLIPLWLAGLFFRYRNQKNKWGAGIDFLVLAAILGLMGFLTGLFRLNSASLSAGGFGSYSWNLNGWINPLQYSAIFPNGIANGYLGQYEGFSYLGLGGLLLLGVGLFLYFQKDYRPAHLKYLLPMAAAALPLTLFALSNQAYLNTQPLWNIDLPAWLMTLFSTFRSSGRFIWPVFYLLFLFGLAAFARNMRHPAPFLVLALLLQLIDIQPLYSLKRVSGQVEFQSSIKSQVWFTAASSNAHILLLPADKTDTVYADFALYAIQNGMTLNSGYLARGDYNAIKAHALQAWLDLQAGKPAPDTLYVFWDPQWQRRAEQELTGKAVICNWDGYTVALALDNILLSRPADLSVYCDLSTLAP